jgi:hypothetical protein
MEKIKTRHEFQGKVKLAYLPFSFQKRPARIVTLLTYAPRVTLQQLLDHAH